MPENFNPADLAKKLNPQAPSFDTLRARMSRANPQGPGSPVQSSRTPEQQQDQLNRMANSPGGPPEMPPKPEAPAPQAQPQAQAKPDISEPHPEPHKDPILDADGDGDVEHDDIKDIVKDNESLMDFVRERQSQLLGNDKKVQQFMDKKFAKFQDSLGAIKNPEVKKHREQMFRQA